jgi:hypothetical protein
MASKQVNKRLNKHLTHDHVDLPLGKYGGKSTAKREAG